MKTLGTLILISFIFLAVFGLFVPVAHMAHDGCLFDRTASCDMLFSHAGHWLSLLVAASLLFFSFVFMPHAVRLGVRQRRDDARYERYRLRSRVPMRPTTIAELLSRGIVHPKVF